MLLDVSVYKHTQVIIDIMPRCRKDTWWSERHDLHTLLRKFERCQVSKSRDKVYALLGISEDAFDPATIRPSYDPNKSDLDVARDTVSFLLFGSVLDENYAFPEFYYPDLSLALNMLAGRILSWSLSRRLPRAFRYSSRRTAARLVSRINKEEDAG